MVEHRCPDCETTGDEQVMVAHNREKRRRERIIATALVQEWTTGDIKALGEEESIKELDAKDYEEIVRLYESFMQATGEMSIDLTELVIRYVREKRVSCKL